MSRSGLGHAASLAGAKTPWAILIEDSRGLRVFDLEGRIVDAQAFDRTFPGLIEQFKDGRVS